MPHLVQALSSLSSGLSPKKRESIFAGSLHPPRHQSYRTRGRDVHYVEVGHEGRPLVLLVHGSPGSWLDFASVMADDAMPARVRLIAVDRPGFGGSNPGIVERSLARQAAALRPILETDRSGRPAILVGHSYGGSLVARMAVDYPERVGALILVAPALDPELEETKWFQIPAQWRPVRRLLPQSLVTTNREILALKGELEELLPCWPQIRVPVTVIQGEKDRLVPPGNADFAARRLVNAALTLVRVADLDHFVPWTRPDLVRRAIVDQLNTDSPDD